MSATYIQSNDAERSSSNNSPIPDQNKICQWYCCLCGQCFGQIYYKNLEKREITYTNDSGATGNNSIVENNLMDRLKYYSKIVYNQSESPETKDNNKIENEAEEEDSDYFQVLPTLNSGLNSPGTTTLELNDRNYNFNFNRETGPRNHLHPDDAQSNNNPYPNNHGTSSKVVLKIPTRFTCHRCDHMMCPYCPKIRLKDLDNDIQ